MRALISAGLFFMISFFVSATAFGAVEDGVPWDLAKPVYEAIMSGEYLWAATAALVLITAIVRKYGAKFWPKLGTGRAAAGIVVFGAFIGAVFNSLAAGESLSWSTVWIALQVAVSAGGAVALLKGLAPDWLLPILNGILGSDSAVTKVGDEAVKKNPSDGPDVDFKRID